MFWRGQKVHAWIFQYLWADHKEQMTSATIQFHCVWSVNIHKMPCCARWRGDRQSKSVVWKSLWAENSKYMCVYVYRHTHVLICMTTIACLSSLRSPILKNIIHALTMKNHISVGLCLKYDQVLWFRGTGFLLLYFKWQNHDSVIRHTLNTVYQHLLLIIPQWLNYSMDLTMLDAIVVSAVLWTSMLCIVFSLLLNLL